MSPLTGLGIALHSGGEHAGLQWEDYLSELQAAVEWKAVVSGANEFCGDLSRYL